MNPCLSDINVLTSRRSKSPAGASSLFKSDLNIQEVHGVDVTKDEGVNCLVQALENAGSPGVDVLINNAGVMMSPRNSLEVDVIQKSMEVNAYGALRVTATLLKRKLLSAPGAKIALITSKMGSMEDNTSGGSYGYRMSKAALNAAGVSLAHDLKGSGIAVAILHPGEKPLLFTSFGGKICDEVGLILANLDFSSLDLQFYSLVSPFSYAARG